MTKPETTALTASAADRWTHIWREAGNPPHPQVSQMGSPASVAAREYAAYVASQTR